MAYVKERYFRCPQCNDTRVVHDKAGSVIHSVSCRCVNAFGFKVTMQEITAAQYNSGQAAPASSTKWPPQNYKCNNCQRVMTLEFDTQRMVCPCGNFVTLQWWEDNIVAPPIAKRPYGRHYDWMVMDDLFGKTYTNRPTPPPPTVRKCRDCGKDVATTRRFFTGTVLCDDCMDLLILRMTQMFQSSKFGQATNTPLKKKVIWTYCHGCGDLLPAYDGLHRCEADHNPLLTVVEFEEETMTPVTNVRVWWDTSVSAYRLASPYNKDLVEGLKAAIPISDRSFDPTTKIWTFVERQLAPIQNLFKMMNVQATIITKAQAEQASQSTPQGPRKGAAIAEIALEFMRVAGPDAMQKAYRAAALALHPDRGGSMDKMSALNAAWERLQKEVFTQ